MPRWPQLWIVARLMYEIASLAAGIVPSKPALAVMVLNVSLDSCALYAGGFYDAIGPPQIIWLFILANYIGGFFNPRAPAVKVTQPLMATGIACTCSLYWWGGFF